MAAAKAGIKLLRKWRKYEMQPLQVHDMVNVGQIAVSIVNNSLNFSCDSLSIKLAAVL